MPPAAAVPLAAAVALAAHSPPPASPPPASSPHDSLPLESGVTLQLRLPADVEPLAAPAWSLQAAPGLEWLTRQSWHSAAGESLQLGCAGGSARLWVHGMEALALDGASALARQAAAASSLTPGPVVSALPHGYSQNFSLDGGAGEGRHLLAFSQTGERALLCTLICRGDQTACARTLASARFEGSLAPPPTDTLPARGLELLGAHPAGALVVALALLVAVAAGLLATRPRPRQWPWR